MAILDKICVSTLSFLLYIRLEGIYTWGKKENNQLIKKI